MQGEHYDSVAAAVEGIQNVAIGRFGTQESRGEFCIYNGNGPRERARIRYTIKEMKLTDFCVRLLYSDASMEQSLGILVKTGRHLDFNTRGLNNVNEDDFKIGSLCHFDMHDYDENNVRLASKFLGTTAKELRRKIDDTAQHVNRHATTAMRAEMVNMTLLERNGHVQVRYWPHTGKPRKTEVTKLTVRSARNLGSKAIVGALVKAFGHDNWRCFDGRIENEDDRPNLKVLIENGPVAEFARYENSMILNSTPEFICDPEDAGLVDEILAAYEPFTRKE